MNQEWNCNVDYKIVWAECYENGNQILGKRENR
jgi:hypothetical protein